MRENRGGKEARRRRIDLTEDYVKRYLRNVFIGVLLGLLGALFLGSIVKVHAREGGEFNNDPEVREWFKHLMRPDIKDSPCCGEADGYWCDIIHVRGDKVYCSITDDRDDAPRGRPHIDIGTEIEIPPEKMKWGPHDPDKSPPSNPTGHSMVFLGGSAYGRYVFCFISGTGI